MSWGSDKWYGFPRAPLEPAFVPRDDVAALERAIDGGTAAVILELVQGLGGAVALVVGDVAGADLKATVLMAQLRSAGRAYALEGHPPAVVVSRANDFHLALRSDRLATLAHALVWRGVGFAVALFATTALGGLVIEVVGVSTGLPFGEYRYLDSLGAQLLGVPVVVALAWTMMAYPAYVVSEVIGGGALRRSVVGGWALASWDLFLDPQMVQAGHWEWSTTGPALAGIPVTNYAAWFAVATVMMLVLRALSQPEPAVADDRVPLALYVWTWASSVMAHAVFFDLPVSAALGGIGMGVVVLALPRARR